MADKQRQSNLAHTSKKAEGPYKPNSPELSPRSKNTPKTSIKTPTKAHQTPEKNAFKAAVQKVSAINALCKAKSTDTPPVGASISLQVQQQDVVGRVAFVGEAEFAAGMWVGVVLESAIGKNDGSMNGKRYFNCAPGHGLFLRPGKVQAIVEWPVETPNSVGSASTDTFANLVAESVVSTTGTRSISEISDPLPVTQNIETIKTLARNAEMKMQDELHESLEKLANIECNSANNLHAVAKVDALASELEEHRLMHASELEEHRQMHAVHTIQVTHLNMELAEAQKECNARECQIAYEQMELAKAHKECYARESQIRFEAEQAEHERNLRLAEMEAMSHSDPGGSSVQLDEVEFLKQRLKEEEAICAAKIHEIQTEKLQLELRWEHQKELQHLKDVEVKHEQEISFITTELGEYQQVHRMLMQELMILKEAHRADYYRDQDYLPPDNPQPMSLLSLFGCAMCCTRPHPRSLPYRNIQ